MRHIAVHAGIEIELVEVVMREEVEQFGAGHLFGVSSGLAQDTQDTCTATVLGRCDLLQIVERPVHHIAVDVIDLHAFGSRSDEGLPHEMMTVTAGEMAHKWIPRMTPFPVTRLMSARFKFFAIGIVEAAVRTAEKGLATYAFRWHLFVNRRPTSISCSMDVHWTSNRAKLFTLKGRKKIYITHNTANRRDKSAQREPLGSERRCKVQDKKKDPQLCRSLWKWKEINGNIWEIKRKF